MSGRAIQPYQIQVYMNAREQEHHQSEAAAIAGISERSGRRIEQGEHQPERGKERDWRTRDDPLAAVWQSELEPMLEREPRLEAMTLYEHLQQQYPGQYQQVLRTLQRRVSHWKARHGESPEVMFEIAHPMGEMGLSDFTQLKGISVSIQGETYVHLLYHYRLAYSGWQYVQIIQGGESFIGLSQGLQNARWASGGAPKQHRSDSLSAADRNSGGKRKLTERYDALCGHYRMQPSRNNTGIAHENGAIEESHGHFKHRLQQALYLRGSNEFESVAAYQQLIDQVIAQINANCSVKFEQERAYLQPLPRYRYPDYEVMSVRVSCRSTIAVRSVLYTVPSSLVGRKLTIHLYHNAIIGYLGQHPVVELPRLIACRTQNQPRRRCINYRHIIAALRLKPRAFLYATWQQEILPNDHYRQLWQRLKTEFETDSAARVMVEALYIAATQDKETAVADYLQMQLQQGTLTLAGLQHHFQLLTQSPPPPEIEIQQHSLSSDDELFDSPPDLSQPLREPDVASENPQTQPHAQPLATA